MIRGRFERKQRDWNEKWNGERAIRTNVKDVLKDKEEEQMS